MNKSEKLYSIIGNSKELGAKLGDDVFHRLVEY